MIHTFKEYLWINEEITRVDIIDPDFFSTGQTVYEVLRVVNGKPLFAIEHYKRFVSSASRIGKQLPITFEQFSSAITSLVIANSTTEGNIELLYNYGTPEQQKNIWLAWFIPHHYPSDDDYKYGVNTMFYYALRTDPQAKVKDIPLRDAANVIMKAKNLAEVILVDKAGRITEGSRSNIFFIIKDALQTASDSMVLSGITREKVLELARTKGIEVIEHPVMYNNLTPFDAAFITGTSPKILPIKDLEGHSFNVENKLLRQLMDDYNELLNSFL